MAYLSAVPATGRTGPAPTGPRAGGMRRTGPAPTGRAKGRVCVGQVRPLRDRERACVVGWDLSRPGSLGTEARSPPLAEARIARMAAILEGWQSTQRQRDDGTIDSLQSARMSAPVVPMSEEGAARLGRAYWQAVETSTGRLIRARERPDGLELRLLARDPVLLAFGPPELTAADGQVSCRYPIRGGILARREAGAITLAQTGRGRRRAHLQPDGLRGAARRAAGASAVDGHALPARSGSDPRGDQQALLLPARADQAVKVAVFGATGVIGRELVPVLAAEHEVVAVSRRAVETQRAERLLGRRRRDRSVRGVARARRRGDRLLPRPLARLQGLRAARSPCR